MFRVAAPFSPSRRAFAVGGAALLAATAITPAFASVESFLSGVWGDARAAGVSRAVFDSALGGFRPLEDVMELSRKQPEFTTTAADYVGRRVNDRQIGTGQSMRGEWSQTLGGVAQRFGVQSEIVLAIWGIETNFGGYMGSNNTVHALATLTHGGYRSDYFGAELITSLKILQQGHITASKMVGSWAGAMGHTQFMPSSFMQYAVDFRGDGHKDIWGSIPDALASAANYLREHGWRPGETWGYEVKLPRSFDYNIVWSGTTASIAQWQEMGITRASGRPFPRGGDQAKIYMPMGGNGPAFLTLPNFGVIKRYNNSDSYALAVGHLADRILGSDGFIASWPDDTALNKAQRQEVQRQLLARGYDIGSPDGVLGPKTRAAVINWQGRNGMFPDGHVGGRLLAALS